MMILCCVIALTLYTYRNECIFVLHMPAVNRQKAVFDMDTNMKYFRRVFHEIILSSIVWTTSVTTVYKVQNPNEFNFISICYDGHYQQ